MNKYITMLLLGVVVVAMALVLGVHMNKFGDGGGPESAGSQSSQTVQSGQAPEGVNLPVGGGRLEPPSEDTGSATGSLTPGEGGQPDAGSAGTSSTSGQTAAAQGGDARNGGGTDGGTVSYQPGAQPGVQTDTRADARTGTREAGQAAQGGESASGRSGGAQTGERSDSASSATGQASGTQTAVSGTAPSGAASAASGNAGQSATEKSASVTRGKGSIKTAALKFRGNGMYLLIEGDSALPAKYFLLHNPERLVVDLPGAWKGLTAPAIPSNQLVKSARVGRQSDADRLVIDLSRKLKKHELVRLDDRTVEIVFE